jgi:hypothetical protein
MTLIVTTQEELDAALTASAEVIEIQSPRGVWLEISDSGSASVSASGSATVSASGSATVHASGSATVRASGSATVSASGSATVSASGSATVSASGSATVSASGSASVHASGSATVHASGSATVSASGSATVRASGSASVHASGSATVHASGSASVRAYGSATVHASRYVAVHLHSQRITLDGNGHVIDLTGIDFNDSAQWCEFHDVEVSEGIAYVYKAVSDEWLSGYGTDYRPGSTPEAADWEATQSCGKGLHFCAHPSQSLKYKRDATKFVRCGVPLNEMVTLGDKIKARRVVVGCVEVDVHGRVVEGAAR